MSADLHCHTVCSDGSSTPEEVVLYAKKAGLDAVAITDHDTLLGIGRGVDAGEKLGILVVPSVEFSAKDLRRNAKVHLLCYLPSRPENLEPLWRKLLPMRDESFRESLRRVQEQYPIVTEKVLAYAQESPTLYQVHIMRALMEMGYTDSVYSALYEKLLGDEGTCKVSHDYLDMWEVVERIKSAGGVCVMAHPSVYRSVDTMQELAAAGALDGVEVSYPRFREQDRAAIRDVVAKYDLIPTGGTDFHGAYSATVRPVGTCVTTAASVDRIFRLARTRM